MLPVLSDLVPSEMLTVKSIVLSVSCCKEKVAVFGSRTKRTHAQEECATCVGPQPSNILSQKDQLGFPRDSTPTIGIFGQGVAGQNARELPRIENKKLHCKSPAEQNLCSFKGALDQSRHVVKKQYKRHEEAERLSSREDLASLHR